MLSEELTAAIAEDIEANWLSIGIALIVMLLEPIIEETALGFIVEIMDMSWLTWAAMLDISGEREVAVMLAELAKDDKAPEAFEATAVGATTEADVLATAVEPKTGPLEADCELDWPTEEVAWVTEAEIWEAIEAEACTTEADALEAIEAEAWATEAEALEATEAETWAAEADIWEPIEEVTCATEAETWEAIEEEICAIDSETWEAEADTMAALDATLDAEAEISEATEAKEEDAAMAFELAEARATEALEAAADALKAAAEALEAAAAEMLEAEAKAAETLFEASEMIEEMLTVGLAVTVAVTVEFNWAKAEVMLPAAKREATGPSEGNPVKEEP